MTRLLPLAMVALALLLTATAHAAAPGITGPTFNLTAKRRLHHSAGRAGDLFVGLRLQRTRRRGLLPGGHYRRASATTMQVPGPTLIVTEGQTVTVTLTNGLPMAAGNTSILFPGFQRDDCDAAELRAC